MEENQKEYIIIEEPLSYASLGARVKSSIIDGFIIIVIYSVLLYLLKDQLLSIAQETKSGVIDEENAIFIACMATILCLFFDIWYYVLFAKKHHGTFGQLTQDLRISLRDGTVAGYNAVSLRHIPGFIVLANILLCMWLFFFLPLQMWMAKIPIYLICVTHGYIFLNMFVVASNQKRKSLSDLWAHTAVIHFSSLKEKVDIVFVDEVISNDEENNQNNK